MKILVTGASGTTGQAIISLLVERGHQVLGIDRRGSANPPPGLQLFRGDVRKRAAEDVFRTHKPEGVIHLATVSHLLHPGEEGNRVNLNGTKAVFDYSHRYGVKAVVFVGRHTFYGADPDGPLYHREDEPPSSASAYPSLSDLVAADLYAGASLWRYPEISTSVLRTCYTLGASQSGTLATFLGKGRVPTFIGYDPLFQVMHESDAVRAIVIAMEKRLRGVFNVAGPAPLPLSAVIRESGRLAFPVPAGLMRFTMGRFGLSKLPKGAWDHIRFPIVMDASAFVRATQFEPEYDEVDVLHDYRRRCPPPSLRSKPGRSLP